MKTPIIDFVNQYKNDNKVRLHMPGHKGKSYLGYETYDITEIDGADSLYFAGGIIKESEKNASSIFGCDTFYSTEGSSLCIRAMLYLAMTYHKKDGKRSVCLASRNVHKTFVTAAALLDFDVKWVYSKSSNTYHSCILTANDIEDALKEMDELPFAVYLTSPDYLGNISDIKGIAKVCKKYGVLLLVDNAHGAYLKFLNESLHPIDLGADMCSSSAHKTIPALTGAAYLQLSNNLDSYYHIHAKEALGMFASTSPSYLILQSLDYMNLYLEENKDKYNNFVSYLEKFKIGLSNNGYVIIGDEKMKITIDAKAYGYSGNELADYLLNNNIVSEFHDNDYVVLMPTLENDEKELDYTKEVLLKLTKKTPLEKPNFVLNKKQAVMSIREASFSKKRLVNANDAVGEVLADTAVTCPPAIPIVVCGEEITEDDIKMFKYYQIDELSIVDKA